MNKVELSIAGEAFYLRKAPLVQFHGIIYNLNFGFIQFKLKNLIR